MTIYIDEVNDHDHTYYGNGCTIAQYPSGQNGSPTPCTTRIVKEKDGNNQEQKIGTYYGFQAATSGTGGNIYGGNNNSPDTFCPLGWQLPYSGTGGDYYDKSRSYKYLFTSYSIATDTGGTADAAKIFSYPLSYVFSGYFHWRSGRLYIMNSEGRYWTSNIDGTNNAYYLYHWGTGSRTEYSNYKTSGHPLRCDCGISILESFPWHPRPLISIMAFHFLKAHFPSVKIMSNYLKNETKYFIFMELRANFDEAESKYKMENRILMSE